MYYSSTKEIYEGQWRNNLKNGEGTFYYSDGRVRRGKWRDDLEVWILQFYYLFSLIFKWKRLARTFINIYILVVILVAYSHYKDS